MKRLSLPYSFNVIDLYALLLSWLYYLDKIIYITGILVLHVFVKDVHEKNDIHVQ